MRSPNSRTLALITGVVAAFTAVTSLAEENYENPPIAYSKTAPADAVTRLQSLLADGQLDLTGGEQQIVRTILTELAVPVASQLLVFSRTSLQRDRISPKNPRALYYSDTCYVGWVPGGLIEITAIEPQLGPTFYVIDPRNPERAPGPQFTRDSDCLRCHGGHFVRGIPGVFARSVFPDATGEPLFRLGSTLVDYRTPFEERWGGWYVTGQHGRTLHRGNTIASDANDTLDFPHAEGANLTDLSPHFNIARYPMPSSDIVSLLVFEHQIAVQNAITKASMEARRMLHYQAGLQEAFGEPTTAEPAYDSVKSVFASVTQNLVDHLLSKDEAPLPFGIKGGPEFIEAYASEAHSTREGNSLRDLSLRRRLYKFRCSPLIYSPMFHAMPASLKRQVYTSLVDALSKNPTTDRYTYIPEKERAEIRTILQETLPEIRPYFSRI